MIMKRETEQLNNELYQILLLEIPRIQNYESERQF